MKRIVSLALSILMILSALSMFSVIGFAEGQTMIIKPSRYGAWENWINSPNLMGDYESTTQLLVEATDAQGNALTLPTDAQWELTISSGSTSKTIKMNPATTLPADNLYRFETCNGIGENKFVPVKGTTYTISAKIYRQGEVIYQSDAVSGFTCGMDPVDPAVELPEPAGTATLTIGAWYDIIENWGTPARTYFIAGVSASEATGTLYTRLKNGKYKLYVTVTDETANTTKTVYYPINKPSEELYGTSFMRLALGEKGVEIVKDHAYTLEIKVYNRAGELKYAGKSSTGIFKSKQAAFLADGPITPDYPVGDADSALAEKSVLFVGDSITEAICEVNIAETKMMAGWPGRIGVANNMYFVNKGLSGASISDCRGSNTVLNQLSAMKNRTFDLVIMHGGVNDAWDSAAVGQMTALDNFDETTFDQTTFAGGLEYLFWYAKTYYPNAVKGYLISFRLPGATIGRLSDMSEYFEEAKKICDKWGIPYLDMYNNEELNMRMKGTTRYAMGDYIHPNDRGYDILYPFVEQFCECIMEGGDPSKLTNPAPLPEEENGITSSDINVALGKTAVNGAGSSIPGATDGKTNAYVSLGNWDAANCYVEIDLGTYYKVDKINVVNYIGNLLYNWEAYVSEDNSLPIDQWINVGEKNSPKQSYEDGHTISFDPTTAKYVRIYGTYHNGSSAYVVNEVSVYGTPDEEAVLNGTTVENIITPDMSATLTNGSTTDKLTDGNKVSDPFVMNKSEGGWCQADLGSAQTVSKIIVNLAETNSAFKLIGSTDGSYWTTIATKALNEITTTTPRSQFIVTDINTSYRYVRVVWMDSQRSDGYVSVSELEIYGEDGETRLAATASISNAVYNNSQDGNYTSYSFIKGSTDTITIHLGASKNIRKIVLYTADYRYGFRIEVSENGSTYTSFGANTVSELYDAAKGYILYGDANCRYIRIIPTAFVDDKFSAYEIEVFAVTETTDPDPEPNPDPEPETPTEEELTDKEEVTITLGNGTSGSKLKDDVVNSNYTLIAEGDKCYALIDLQKNYTVTKAVIYALNGNYLFEIYGSTDGETWTKLAANEKSTSYNAAEGFVMDLTGNYRYIKVMGTECQYGYFTTYEMDVFGYEATVVPDPEPEIPAEEELSNKDGVTATVGQGLYTNNINDGITDRNYTLVTEGNNCYVILDLQKVYTLTKTVVYTSSKDYDFKVYGSTNGETWTELGASVISTDYTVANGYTVALEGNYRYVKIEGITTQHGYFTAYEIDVYGYEPVAKEDAVVKFEGHQMGTNGNSIRFIGSISDLDYESVDLQITVTGDASKTFSNPTTKVFQILKGSIAGVNQAVAATANSGVTGENVTVIEAAYLFGYAITGIDAGTYTFTIVPVATTYDGQTVKGETATITVTID